MDLTLHIWRQKSRDEKGRMVTYPVAGIDEHSSFLEMLDVLNEQLVAKGEEPVAFDSDCREGICGMCSLVINGVPHGPDRGATVCQLHMRHFRDGDEIWIEPWRAKAFPVMRDLVVDRGAFDRIVQAGGYIHAKCGSAPDANSVPIPKDDADLAFNAAACIGCGACVAAPLRQAAPGPARAPPPRAEDGRADGQGRLRQLHELLRVRGGLPEGDPRGIHRGHEPRLPRLRPQVGGLLLSPVGPTAAEARRRGA